MTTRCQSRTEQAELHLWAGFSKAYKPAYPVCGSPTPIPELIENMDWTLLKTQTKNKIKLNKYHPLEPSTGSQVQK